MTPLALTLALSRERERGAVLLPVAGEGGRASAAG